ncbi:MAG: hypothetical protein WC889_11380 [Myxococcota bacterium]
MRTNRSSCLNFLALLFVAPAVAGCSSGTSNNIPGNNKIPPAIQSMADAVVRDLTAQGYEVSRGYMKTFTNEDCASAIAVMGQCFANNPTAPYVLPILKTWKDEYVDPATVGGVGKVAAGYASPFRFDPREAVVLLGVMPPEARYFGCQTYQFTAAGVVNKTTDIYKRITENFPDTAGQFFDPSPSGRLMSFASISNSSNNVEFEQQAGTFFGQVRSFIITPDQAMDRTVRASLAKSGLPATSTLTEAIPSSVTTGLTTAADDFVTIIRYALPRDEKLGNQWRQDLPVAVIRVRDAKAAHQSEPFPAFDHPAARSSVDENWLSTDLDTLNNNVRAAWGLPPAPVQPSLADRMMDMQRVMPFDLVGPDCMRNTMNCWGDTQDTSYSGNGNVLLENDAGQILYAVVGTLGTKTGNGTYMSLSVYRALYIQGVENVSDAVLETSQGKLPQQPASFQNADKFFLWYFARSCAAVTTGNCTEIPESLIPRGEPMKLAVRNYIKPGTMHGPNTDPAVNPLGQSPLLTPWVIPIPLEAR